MKQNLKKINRPYQKQQGFTLIEALLALFILSIGLLGIAGMHVEGMKSSNIAMQRMVVTIKTQDLLDRIRANATNESVALNNYKLVVASNQACNSGIDCSATNMMSHDLFLWQSDLNNYLPGNPVYNFTMTDVIDPVSKVVVSQLVTVNINWTDRGNAQSYSVTTQI
ncbi:MAG: type IV pilus modification protein PilV [Gammaproteobacteria bacterium]|nr:type IV pilus modification protein PilV [Gammaproteobacteria bacterium]MCW8910738.1 type IV pilus modification protein PilV [Gammaproteobacteria bacterium]MCW9004374.1 type IV pilus modification protein PilV [Gammaproteobacteria bacterium]MCW9056934.1 type IV pilus modification protein PilV [Gammaproteobacteria bacterium]